MLRDEHGVPGLPGRRLHPRGDIHGVADHRKLEPPGAADVTGDDAAGVETDADQELAAVFLGDGAFDLEGRGQCLVGVIGLAAGSAEDGEQAIADELVDVTAVLVDDRHGG